MFLTDVRDPTLDPIEQEMAPTAKIWSVYLKHAKEYDEKMISDWNNSIDVLLVFVRNHSPLSFPLHGQVLLSGKRRVCSRQY